MNITRILWIGLMALVMSGCNKTTSSGAAAPAPPPAVGVGVAAAADGATRYELWLLYKQPDQTSAPVVQPGKIIDDYLKDLNVASLLTRVGMTDWQTRVLWAWDDMGPMEPVVQKEIARLDGKYTMNMYAACVWPATGLASRVGRACVSQSYACYAARNKMDERAMDIMAATQMHNDAATQSLRSAGATVLGDFLRNNRYCK